MFTDGMTNICVFYYDFVVRKTPAAVIRKRYEAKLIIFPKDIA